MNSTRRLCGSCRPSWERAWDRARWSNWPEEQTACNLLSDVISRGNYLEQSQPLTLKSIAEDFHSRRFAIYILGAGFSRPAGFPLAVELWDEVRKRAFTLKGRAEYFKEDLQGYIEYRRRCDGIELTANQVNFEDFVAFLDIEHYLGLRGKDTWSSDGNETQVVIKTLIGEILTERMPSKVPELYLEFARMLRPPDYVLTFNYDILLERALELAGVPFRLFPDRLKKSDFGHETLVVDSKKEEVIVLKVHGSIDWFDRTHCNQLEELAIRQGLNPVHSDMVFSNMEKLGVVPLLEGEISPDDPLRYMYRVRNIEQLYRGKPMFHVTPSLLNPSSLKILYSQMLRDFWWGLGDAGILNFGMAIIGFSLPSQDEYARQIIYRLVRNYQNYHWEKGELQHNKSPLVVIDYRKSTKAEKDFRNRYAFIDWTKAETYLGGFDKQALDLLRSA